MLLFLLLMVKALPFGFKMVNAFEGIGVPPSTARAARLRTVAVMFLTTSAASLVAAAIIWRPLRPLMIADVLGWAGVGLFVVFVIIGDRCHSEGQTQTDRQTGYDHDSPEDCHPQPPTNT